MNQSNISHRAINLKAISVKTISGSRLCLPVMLSLTLFFSFFYRLHAFPLFDLDEGAFSEATREMLESGDYITTYLNGNLRFDKPILIYWFQAISVSVFGINEFAFRLPSALASIGWISAILIFTRDQIDRMSGFAAALIAATSLGISIIGRGAIADALLNLFLVLTMFDIYRYMEHPDRKLLYRAFLWMGFGLLTKGPIAILIPLAVSAALYALHGKGKLWLKAALSPIGWLILMVIAGPWYLLEYQAQGQKFIDGFIMRHNVERFQGTLEGHSGGFLYYIPAVLLLLLPYSGLLLCNLKTLRMIRRDPLTAFLWIWFLFVLVFFSFSGTKLPHYLIYGLTPLCILMAIHRENLKSKWAAFIPPLLFFLFAIFLPNLLTLTATHIKNLYFQEMLSQQGIFGHSYYFFISVLFLLALTLAFMPRWAIWQRLIAIGCVCVIALSGLILPGIAQLQQGPVKEAALLAKTMNEPVTSWRINMPSFSVYRNAITPPHKPPGKGELIFTRTDRLSGLGPVEIIYRKGGIALVRRLPQAK